MNSIWQKTVNFVVNTKIPEQIEEVDFIGLFTNPWFMVPFVLIIVYMLIRQAWKEVIIIAVLVGVWWVSGTEYMGTLIVGDTLQIDKVLPVVFGGAAALGLVIYLLFGRSD